MEKIITLAFICLAITALIFQDSAAFQNFMDMVFGGAPAPALPEFWIEYRQIIIPSAIALLLIRYASVIKTYGKLVAIYRKRELVKQKPPLPALQASQLFMQNPVALMASWLIGLCQSGCLKLHYRDKTDSWSISSVKRISNNSDRDRELVDTLLGGSTTTAIMSRSEPSPAFRQVSARLYKLVQHENTQLITATPHSFWAWLLLVGMLIEIPFLNTMQSESPLFFAANLACVVFTGAFAYLVHQQFTLLFVGPGFYARILIIGAFLFVVFFHYSIFSSGISGPYFESTVFMEIVTVIAVLVTFPPVYPVDATLFEKIAGYRRTLNAVDANITEEDLAWSLGLCVGDGYSNSIRYEGEIPVWIESNKTNPETLISKLHNSLPAALRKAIHGTRLGRSSRSGRLSGE